MSEQVAVAAPTEQGWEHTRTVISALLVVAAMVLLWAGDRQFTNLLRVQQALFKPPTWAGWPTWNGLLVLSGFAFGLAGWLPRRFGYHPTRVLLLGTIPLLMLIQETLVAGPEFSSRNFDYLARHPFFFDGTHGFGAPFVVPVLLGVAIAAGFSSV